MRNNPGLNETDLINTKRAVIILAAAFILGALALTGYGLYYDEISEGVILRQNIYEYALRLFPEDSGIVRHFKGTVRISESVERDHGVAVMYPFFVLKLLGRIPALHTQYNVVVSGLWHGYVYVVSFTAVIAFFYIGKKLFGSNAAGLLTASFFFLSPKLFAEMHYNNKDMLLLVLTADMIALVIRTADIWKTEGRLSVWNTLLLCLTGGFAMNLRAVGIAITVLCGLLYIVLLIREGFPAKKTAAAAAVTLLLTLVFFYLLTPAMWGGFEETADYFRYIFINAREFSRWDWPVLFDGEFYIHSENPLPRSYLIRMMLYTIPPYISLFFLAGLVALIFSLFTHKSVNEGDYAAPVLIFSAVEFAVPILFAALARTLVYNSWRHFFFVYPGFAIVAAYGAMRVASLFKNRKLLKTAFSALLVIMLTVTAAGIAVNHPFEHSYFNFLAAEPDKNYQLDYWNVGMNEALNRVYDDCSGREEPALVTGANYDEKIGLSDYFNTFSYEGRIGYTDKRSNADYIIENTTYTGMYGSAPVSEDEFNVMDELYSYGNRIYVIYKRK